MIEARAPGTPVNTLAVQQPPETTVDPGAPEAATCPRYVGRAALTVRSTAGRMAASRATPAAGVTVVFVMEPGELTSDRPGESSKTPEADALDEADPAIEGLRLYLKDLPDYTLKAEQEVALAKQIQAGLQAGQELAATGNLSDQLASQLRQTQAEGERAKNAFVTANLRLVVSLAKRYQRRGLEYPDLIQEGNMALMSVVEAFDYTKGYKFSTFATPRIRGAILRAISNQGRTIRLPVGIGDQVNRVFSVRNELAQRLGREPGREEVAAKLGISLEALAALEEYDRVPVSLDVPVDEDGQTSSGGRLSSRPAAATDEHSPRYRLLCERVKAAVEATVDHRYRRAVLLRLGVVDGRQWTLEEIGTEIGRTKGCAHQIITRWLPVVAEALQEFAP